MNLRATVVLLLIALGLGLWVWFGETGGRVEEPGAQRLLPLEIEDVTALELPLQGGGRVRLARADDGTWALESPLVFPAAPDVVVDLLRDVTGLESTARLDDLEADRTTFGLDAASEVIRVEAGDAGHVLRRGRATPFGSDAYVSIDGEPAVYTVPGWKLDALRRELRALRDPRMYALDADEVDTLRIEIAGEPLAAARRMDGSWVLTEPFAEPADQGTVTRLLEDFELARATGFVDTPGPPSQYGLEPPQVLVELGAGEALDLRLEMGGEGEQRYLRVAGTQPIYEIATRIADGVPRSVFTLRDRQVLEIDEGQIDRVVLAFPRDDLRLAFVRGEQGWEPDGHEQQIDETRLEELVYALSDLDAVEIPAPDTQASALGLEPALLRVELADEDGAELGWLELGDPQPGTGIGARASQKQRLWFVDEALGEELPLGAESFRDRWLRGEDGE